MFNAQVICSSQSSRGPRLTTIIATYPRIIHAEILTHRDRARNSASSRAIPWPKMMAAITEKPFLPLSWLREQKGMQGGDSIPDYMIPLANIIWLETMEYVAKQADKLHHIGRTFETEVNGWGGKYSYLRKEGEKFLPHLSEEDKDIKIHKSLPNRLTEPWMWITVVMTATEWNNFFRLRCHPDAEQHFQKIAGMIRDALDLNTPTPKYPGDWHLPFVSEEELEQHTLDVLQKVSVARCARVSYLTHDGVRSIEKDLELFDRLVQGSGFGHWSPHEHVAMCHTSSSYKSGPFRGWMQFRKQFPQENTLG